MPQAAKSRSAIGRKAKADGKQFERLIVTKLRAAGIESQRNFWQSMQEAAGTGGARVPDVCIDGFWPELGDGKSIKGVRKLMQARADLDRNEKNGVCSRLKPVAITRREGERTIRVTISVDDLIEIVCRSGVDPTIPVQMDFDSFVQVLHGLQREEEREQREDGQGERETVWRTIG